MSFVTNRIATAGIVGFALLTGVLGFELAGSPSASAAGDTGTISGKIDATPAKYLADTIVYVKKAPGKFEAKSRDMDQKGMAFVPHIVLVTVGDTVKFLNHDGVEHNVFSPDGEKYNLGSFKTNETRTYTFKAEGVYTQLCSVHPEMLGYIFVGQNPYAAVVGADGKFSIPNVPAGTYELDVWNPKLKAASQNVTVAAGKTAEANFAIKR